MRTLHCTFRRAAFVALVAVGFASHAGAAPITGWAVHNGTSTVGGTASAPTFTGGDNITVMAPFTPVTLDSDGDVVEVKTTLTLNNRTANTGVAALNTQLRVGVFNGPAGAIVASDIPNVGFIIEYSNLGGLIREQTNTTQVSPFTNPTNLTNTGSLDSEGDSIRGANPGPVTFTLRLTRSGGKIDLTGSISGTDSTTSGAYFASYSQLGHSSATHPANGSFTFNRIGLFLGPNVDATSALVTDSTVAVPEPAACGLLALGGLFASRRAHRNPNFVNATSAG